MRITSPSLSLRSASPWSTWLRKGVSSGSSAGVRSTTAVCMNDTLSKRHSSCSTKIPSVSDSHRLKQRSMSSTSMMQHELVHEKAPLQNKNNSDQGISLGFELDERPDGDLFHLPHGPQLHDPTDMDSLVGRTGRIRRTFGPRANAAAMLTCGGEALVAQTSWDPHHGRAISWIRQHAVGPAVLSPILVTGLTGALVQAAFPHAIHVQQEMQQVRALIVGVTVEAEMEVTDVTRRSRSETIVQKDDTTIAGMPDQMGYQVTLETKTTRAMDRAEIASGKHVIWIPDYTHIHL